MRRANVRFGSTADIEQCSTHVCFIPESGHSPTRLGCPFCATCGHRRPTTLHLQATLAASPASRNRGLAIAVAKYEGRSITPRGSDMLWRVGSWPYNSP